MKKGCPRAYIRKFWTNYKPLSYPGRRTTTKVITDWLCGRTWHKTLMQQCTQSQKDKITKHTKSPIGEFQKLGSSFIHLHIDIVGPLSNAHGITYAHHSAFPVPNTPHWLSQKLYWTNGSEHFKCHLWLLLTENHSFNLYSSRNLSIYSESNISEMLHTILVPMGLWKDSTDS